jgi:hypothetical protein
MSTKTRKVPIVVVATIVLLTITAVVLANVRDQAERPDRNGVLEIVLEDYTLQPSEFVLPAGEPLTLVFTNTQDFSHNIEFGRSLVEQNGRPAGFDEDLLAGIDARVTPARAWIESGAANEGVTISVAPNSTVSVGLTLPTDRVGSWQAGCFYGPGCDPRVGLAAEVTVE